MKVTGHVVSIYLVSICHREITNWIKRKQGNKRGAICPKRGVGLGPTITGPPDNPKIKSVVLQQPHHHFQGLSVTTSLGCSDPFPSSIYPHYLPTVPKDRGMFKL